ncbi:MAG TPA: 4-alpha-glucanotransferase [Sporichthya sp.]|nr:4-alpha-glucanotransferase [Sporichthya sp.]
MTELSPNLVALATACGVATEYWDWRGEYVAVPESTVVAVLEGLGWDATSSAAAGRSLNRLEADRWRRMLPPVVTMRLGAPAPTTFAVHVPHGAPVEVWVELEEGGRAEVRQIDRWVEPAVVDGELIGEATFELPGDLPLGYHRVQARSGDEAAQRVAEGPLIVTPGHLDLPPRLDGPHGQARRTWGYLAQLYQVRSEQSWGPGDLADLAELAEWSATDLRAGFVLINPLHAAAPVPPVEPSPYLPMTRRFASPLYLRVEDVPEYTDLEPVERAAVDALGAPLRGRGGPDDLLDRDASWTAKRAALQLIFAEGMSATRAQDFAAFQAREGAALRDFATWSALCEAHGPEWMAWPEELRDPASETVAAERARLSDQVEFAAWLQWQLDQQLAAVQDRAAAAGMALGVIGDLAVGVHPGGADSWAMRDVLAIGVSVGAPPDAFTQHGQDWSQPPWKPNRLAELGYRPFRDMIRNLLRHAGGIRVDHVMGMFRLWWVPAGRKPSEGTYVRYDHEAMVGVLALEAQRAGAVVIGEDLGTVEPWVRDYLRERGMLGTSILFFERDAVGPLPADAWRRLCLGTVTTHDLPPSAGYLAGEHVMIRDRLGLLTRPADEEWMGLWDEVASWRARLEEEGIDPGPVGDIPAKVEALHRFLARTPALLCGVALADAVGDRRTLNQPGTYREYPNWQLPLLDAEGIAVLLSDLRSSSGVGARVRSLAAAFASLQA